MPKLNPMYIAKILGSRV